MRPRVATWATVIMIFGITNRTIICERSGKDWNMGGSGRSPLWSSMAQGLSGAIYLLRAANARGITQVHLAHLGRVKRLNRRRVCFYRLVGRLHSFSRSGVLPPFLLV